MHIPGSNGMLVDAVRVLLESRIATMYPMEVSSQEMETYLANPSLRTSTGSDWGQLTVRTSLAPASCRYLRVPATPDPWLVSTTGGGPRKSEVRQTPGGIKLGSVAERKAGCRPRVSRGA